MMLFFEVLFSVSMSQILAFDLCYLNLIYPIGSEVLNKYC